MQKFFLRLTRSIIKNYIYIYKYMILVMNIVDLVVDLSHVVSLIFNDS